MSESSIGAWPRRRPLRAPRTTNGACDMFSMPPARTVAASPSSICSAALMTDWMPEPQRRVDGGGGASLRTPPLRHARLEADVARAVDGVAGRLQGVADDDVVHFLGGRAAARKRFLRGDHGEVDGADVAEVAVVLGHRRPRAVDDDDVFHVCSWT